MFRQLSDIWHKSTMTPGQCIVYSPKYGHNRRRLVLLCTYKNCSCSLVFHYPLSHTYLSPYDRWHAVSLVHQVMLHRNPLPGLAAGPEVTSQWLGTQAPERAMQASRTGAPLSAVVHWGWTAIKAGQAWILRRAGQGTLIQKDLCHQVGFRCNSSIPFPFRNIVLVSSSSTSGIPSFVKCSCAFFVTSHLRRWFAFISNIQFCICISRTHVRSNTAWRESNSYNYCTRFLLLNIPEIQSFVFQ